MHLPATRVLLCPRALAGWMAFAFAVTLPLRAGIDYRRQLPVSPAKREAAAGRPAIAAPVLTPLPLRDLAPSGWLATQLDGLAKGLPGQLDAFSPACRPEHNPWAEPASTSEPADDLLPQWLRGAIPLAQLAHEAGLQTKTRAWIDTILAAQQDDGWLGPLSLRAQRDLWPSTVFLQALIGYARVTGDPRVRVAIARHLAWIQRLPEAQLLPDATRPWQAAELMSALTWLYERTGEPSLPELARRIYRHSGDWRFTLPTRDDLGFATGFTEPAEYFRFPGQTELALVSGQRFAQMQRERGRLPGGVFLPEEHDDAHGPDPSRGAHACVTATLLDSCLRLLALTGDAVWADRCEDIAFNTVPTIYTTDALALRSQTAPNQVASAGVAATYTPSGPDCCRHAAFRAWPAVASHLWMSTVDGGLAAALYGAGSAKARVGSGVEVTLEEETAYPFDGLVVATVSLARPVRFPLYLRVPAWCSQPGLLVNGRSVRLKGKPGPWIALDRVWNNQDRVELRLLMEPRVELAAFEPRRAVVRYGPLAFSLQIREEWRAVGGTTDWPEQCLTPASAWNLGLVLPPVRPEAALSVAKRLGPLPAQPFNAEAPAIRLIAPATLLADWTAPAAGQTPRLPRQLAVAAGPPIEATLIPMGGARLRLAVFPWLVPGQPPPGH